VTATKTRHLHAVTDTPTTEATAAETKQVLAQRRAELAQAYANARLALIDPDVAEQQKRAVAKAIRQAGREGADQRAILTDLANAMFVLGHVNGATDQQQTRHLDLAAGTLAAVVSIDTAQRQAARADEKAVTGRATTTLTVRTREGSGS
jgi:hypothetical protein